MRIVFCGHHNPFFYTITEYIENGIRATGNVVIPFEDRCHLLPGRFRRRIRFLHEIDLLWMNLFLRHTVLSSKPDLVIFSGGNRILPNTVTFIRGLRTPTVLWTTDAPKNFRQIIKIARRVDHVFCQGTEAVRLLAENGVSGARWLPMACDPTLHDASGQMLKDGGYAERHDVVFIGSYYPNRLSVLAELDGFDIGIYGPGWQTPRIKGQLQGKVRGGPVTPGEWVKIYASCKIALSVHMTESADGYAVYQASPRVFEAMSCGAFLLSDRQADVLALFDKGVHLDIFDDTTDLKHLLSEYLSDEEKRRTIAARGKNEVRRYHTYRHRIEEMISSIR